MEVKVIKGNLENFTGSGVYLIRNLNTKLLKIGCTKNLKCRFHSIKNSFRACGSVPNLKIEAFIECDDYIGLEKFIHSEVYDFRVQSEWFNINDIEPIFLISSYFSSLKKEDINSQLSSQLVHSNNLSVLNILNNKDLNSNEKVIYMTLSQLCLETGYSSLPLESLSQIINLSESTIRRSLMSLQKHKLLLYHYNFESGNKRQLSNTYYIIECDNNGLPNESIYNRLNLILSMKQI